MQNDRDVGDRETTIDGREVDSVTVEGRKIGKKSIAGREICVEDRGVTIGGIICNKKIMVDKVVNDAKELTNVGTVINNDGMVMNIKFVTGMVMRQGDMCDRDPVSAIR